MILASAQGVALIQRYEGFSPVIYRCPAGVPTIGYGHAVRAGEGFPPQGITRARAQEILEQDVQRTAQAVSRLITVPLTQHQVDALVSFTFNLGAGALQRSSLRRKINRCEHVDVPAEFLKWVWVGGRKSPGLLRRRTEESFLYSS